MRLYHGVACMHFFPLPFLVCLYVYIDNKCVSCLAQMVSLFILRLPMRSAVPFLILPPYVATKFIKDVLHLGTGNALTKQQMHRDSVLADKYLHTQVPSCRKHQPNRYTSSTKEYESATL